MIAEVSGEIHGGALADPWILLVGEDVQVGEVEEREEQGQSGLQIAVPCNGGIAVWLGCVDGVSDPCRCGKADGEIGESYSSKWNLSLGKSGL